MRRRRDRQVRVEQVLLAAGALAVQRRELLVHRVERERLVRLAALQSLDELLQREHRAVEHRDGGGVGKRAVQAAEPGFDRLAEARRAGETDHAQRAAHLVHVARARLQQRAVLRVGAELRHLLAHHRQGLADLGGDPREQRRIGVQHRLLVLTPP